jgi:hypothetical protein
MAQSDSKNSTAPVVPTRRCFLSTAAGVAAGGAALALATTPPASAATAPASPLAPANAAPASVDPIFEAIEAHKVASAAMFVAVGVVSAREKELHADGKRRFGPDGAEIDAEMLKRETALEQAFDAETDAACALIDVYPTTIAGVLALLHYVTAADTDGELWPRELHSNDGSKIRPFHYFLVESLLEVLHGMVSS